MNQLVMLPALVGDAIDRVMRRGPPKTGIRRLYLLDLLIGYGLRSDLHRGWWCQRALRLFGPYGMTLDDIEGPPPPWSYGVSESRQYDTSRRMPRYVRLWQIHPAVGISEWQAPWKGEARARYRRRVIQIAWRPLRERLEEETGYRALWTPEEAADAAKVYARKPRSLAYRALMCLVDNPLVWKERCAA